MPLVVKDRVRENSVTSGTGTLTLTGAVLGFQTFSSAIGNTNTTYYAIYETGTANWEVGIGTVGAGTLARNTVLESSNAGSLVNFGSASKDVFCTYPAEKSVDIDTPQTLTNKTINASQLVDGSITTAKIANNAITSAKMANGGAEFGMRNRIINGAMQIDQRNAGASVTPANAAYTVDRWQASSSQASKFSVQQNAGAITPPLGFTNYLGVTSLSAYTVLSADYFMMGQNIEGFNIADLGWGTANAAPVTLSFWVRSSLTGTFGGAIRNGAVNRSYPFTYTISSANTWEQKTVTIPGDTSGTWTTNNSTGLTVFFGLGVGSTFSGTAGAWAGANLFSATGATSVVGTSGATFYITGVQLEKGTQATAFEWRSYGTELALCQRYFQAVATSSGFVGITYSGVQSRSYGLASFKVDMRTEPTIILTDGTSGCVTQLDVANGIPATASGILRSGFSFVARTTGTFNLSANLQVVCGYSASAEL